MASAGRPRASTAPLAWLALAFAVAALVLTLTAAALETPLPGDIEIMRRLQAREWVRDFAVYINYAGDWYQWIPFAAAALLIAFGQRLGGGWPGSRLRREALWALAMAAALRYWSELLKAIVRSPRPEEAQGLIVDFLRESYGFPSGHVYSAVLLYGTMAVFARAFLAPRLVEPFRALALVLIVFAGPARIAVGAHWPTDVFGGYLWGAAALCATLAFARLMARPRS